jgi:hypothetical protein
MYEMQFAHDDNMNGTANMGISGYNASNPEARDHFDSQANSSQIGTAQQMNGINHPGDQNQQVYANLLQTQCLGEGFYMNENYYENLSFMDMSVQ